MTELRRTTYLRFELVPTPERKTKVVLVQSIRQGYEPLGVIRWFGRWRQYVFEPERGTLFNADCMDAITSAIRLLMAERRQASGMTTEAIVASVVAQPNSATHGHA